MTAELITGDSPDGVTHVVTGGIVEHGDQRGRQLGFPAANVHGVDGVRFDGVYAGTASAQGTPGELLVPAVKV
jgi:FAD synthase